MNKTVFVTFIFIVAASLNASAQSLLIGHRAGRMDFEENVLPSFKASYEAGVRGFETDIRMTADGEYVISHDGDMKRVYGTHGIVEELPLSTLRTYRTQNGNSIMTVDEFLDFLKDKEGVYVEFEMKTGPEAYPEEKLYKYCDDLYEKIIRHTPEGSKYLLSTFDYRALRYLSSKHPGEDFLMLIHGDPVGEKTIALAKSLGVKRIACTLNGTSRRYVKEAHEKGIVSINLWPGSNVHDMVLAVELGADIICTDVPLECLHFIRENEWLNIRRWE